MNKGRKKIPVDTEMLIKITNVYKDFFNIDREILAENLSKYDKMVLAFHLSFINNVSTQSIALLCGYKHHTAVCYHRKKIFEFLGKKSSISSDEFESKFVTFNAYFNKNKRQILAT
ncbi:hypothetical protein [Chryseobacterium sp. 18068]|uniref:hypothetical protein n=1 Tax=Chryseobacterium sp. 18068 TaxID=2681414 RepID=UPI00135B0C81|nr:hypothetical protein [Chryseobacterium sp. 18068]